MKKILLSLAMAFCFSSAAHSDTYDPATNRLIIPSITVNGVVYTDVVITVGEIISIGGSVRQDDPSRQRTCSFTTHHVSKHEKSKYELTVLPEHNAIRVSITGLSNESYFHYTAINIVQGNNSTEATIYENLPGALWQGDYGFANGDIPSGVVKGGVLSRLPVWLDLNQPFKWVENGREHICS